LTTIGDLSSVVCESAETTIASTASDRPERCAKTSNGTATQVKCENKATKCSKLKGFLLRSYIHSAERASLRTKRSQI